MNIAHALPLPLLVQFLQAVHWNLATFFAEKDGEDDLGGWDDDTDFETDEDDSEDEGEGNDPDPEDEEDDSDDEKKDKSSLFQKKKWRDRARKAEEEAAKAKAEISKLQSKVDGGSASAEERKELEARKFLEKIVDDRLAAIESEREQTKEQAQQQFESELEEVLDEDDKMSEKEVREVAEQLSVSPKVAAAAIKRFGSQKKKEKPRTPQEKKASTKRPKQPTGDDKRPRSLDEVNRIIKAGLN